MGSETLRVRAQVAALGSVANRVSGGLSFLSICDAISVAGAFFTFAILSTLSVAFYVSIRARDERQKLGAD